MSELVSLGRSLNGKAGEDVARLLLEPGSGSEMHRFVGTVLSIRDRKQAVMSLNERGADVARDIDVGAEVPRACARIALSAGTALAVIELLRSLRHATGPSWAVLIFATAGTFALACAQIARLAKERAQRRVSAWNTLLAALLPLLPAEAENPGISSSGAPGCGPAPRPRLP